MDLAWGWRRIKKINFFENNHIISHSKYIKHLYHHRHVHNTPQSSYLFFNRRIILKYTAKIVYYFDVRVTQCLILVVTSLSPQLRWHESKKVENYTTYRDVQNVHLYEFKTIILYFVDHNRHGILKQTWIILYMIYTWYRTSGDV